MSNTGDPLGHLVEAPSDILTVHRQGYIDAQHRRPYPGAYETWQRPLQINYELGRARYWELKGLRGHGVRWGRGETLKAAVSRVWGRDEAQRFSHDSMQLFIEEK